MKDPGYISDAAWNQEAPYRDADGYDLEQDQRWESVDPSGFYYDDSFLPPRDSRPDVVPDVADRDVTPMAAAGLLPGGGQPF